jgi:hypothetical protein
MSNQDVSAAVDLKEFKELYGPPPVLSSEKMEAYDRMLIGFIKCCQPRDFFERMLLKQVVDETWHIERYTRHKSLAMDRRFRQRLEFQAKQRKLGTAKERAEACSGETGGRAHKPT